MSLSMFTTRFGGRTSVDSITTTASNPNACISIGIRTTGYTAHVSVVFIFFIYFFFRKEERISSFGECGSSLMRREIKGRRKRSRSNDITMPEYTGRKIESRRKTKQKQMYVFNNSSSTMTIMLRRANRAKGGE